MVISLKRKERDRMKKSLCIALAVFLLLWIGTLVKCEHLTKEYYEDFEYAYIDGTMIGDIGYFKVLSCDDQTAEVYYVGHDYAGGDVLSFEKTAGEWVMTNWHTVWSDTGSASDVIWPYWWHFIYGGF